MSDKSMASRLHCSRGMRFPLLRLSLAALALALSCAALATAHAQDGKEDEEPAPDPGSGSGSSGSGSDGEPPDHSLSESETAYSGAIMLEGGTDITMGSVIPGMVGTVEGVSRNARFIGNTLYAEAVDPEGNAVAMVGEFYWFESSVPRGSDFFVGVVKARTIPHLAADWVLEHDPVGPTEVVRPDRGATLYVRSRTSPALVDGGFRWDWSLPFRDYHMDAYGTIRMEADYGVGLTSNGSAQTAYQRTEHGVDVEVEAQATGHINSSYNVNTNYEITLYRWDVFTRNSGNMLEWSMFLRTSDRERQNAYHEFFIAMQVDEGGEFHLDNLEVGGHIKRKRDFWLDEHRALSVAVTDIVLSRPAYSPPADDGGDSPADEGGRPWEDEGGSPDGGAGGFDWPDEDGDGSGTRPGGVSSGCAVSPISGAPSGSAAFGPLLLVGLLTMAGLRRRREG